VVKEETHSTPLREQIGNLQFAQEDVFEVNGIVPGDVDIELVAFFQLDVGDHRVFQISKAALALEFVVRPGKASIDSNTESPGVSTVILLSNKRIGDVADAPIREI
jgi:hypothetical protein